MERVKTKLISILILMIHERCERQSFYILDLAPEPTWSSVVKWLQKYSFFSWTVIDVVVEIVGFLLN